MPQQGTHPPPTRAGAPTLQQGVVVVLHGPKGTQRLAKLVAAELIQPGQHVLRHRVLTRRRETHFFLFAFPIHIASHNGRLLWVGGGRHPRSPRWMPAIVVRVCLEQALHWCSPRSPRAGVPSQLARLLPAPPPIRVPEQSPHPSPAPGAPPALP